MTRVDISTYSISEFGRTHERASITVEGDEGEDKPRLDFQSPGTLFRDRDGRAWRILSAEVVETQDPFGSAHVPVRECVYHWRYTAEPIENRPIGGSWDDD